MGLFFKRKEEEKKKVSNYFEDQKALFETKGEDKPKVLEDSYDEYIFRQKDYSDVPKYKAFDEKKVEVVINKDELGYQELNPDIETVNFEKKNLHEDLNEIVNNAPIDENQREHNTSIYDDNLKQEIKTDESIEIIDIDNSNTETVVAEIVHENLEKGEKLSIFGNVDQPIQAKVYEVKETPVERIDVIDVDIPVEEKKETVKLNENGQKICPQCGAPLAPTAPVCFLCGNKF
jgi:ribosomal protein L40E